MASSDQYFSIIPETVLYADISASAVRVYGVLRRHADKDDGTCYPGRARIAELGRMTPRTVDKAIDELIGIGALRVQKRHDPENPKKQLSNQYTVITPSKNCTTPLANSAPPPSKNCSVTRVIEPESENQKTYDQPSVDQAFNTFWKNYPRKVQRKKCLTWWNRHKKHSQQILDSLDVWREYWEQYVPDSQFIPYPHTWLNQERWNEPPPAESNTRTNIVLAVLDNINQQQPALETNNDPF